jgi:hypothetical protein
MRSSGKWISFALFAIAMAGCNRVKLNDERTIEVAVGRNNSIVLDAVKKDQKIKVEISSPGAAVNVYVLLEKDREAVEEVIEALKPSDKILAGEEKTEGATLEANIAAGNAAVILFTNASGKTASVKVKTTN